MKKGLSRQERRQARLLARYVEILNKHGQNSRQQENFLRKISKDGELRAMCDVVRVVRFGASSHRLKVRNPELRKLAKGNFS